MKFRVLAMVLSLAATATGLLVPLQLSASETTTYQYDAQGRLIGSQRSGNVNNGVNTQITYDDADNRQAYVVTGAGSIILKESFEGAIPPVANRPDGGGVWFSQATNSPAFGSKALRLGMGGGHSFSWSSANFVATQTTVTISIYVRDSGVTNTSLMNYSYSNADAAHPVYLGLYNATTDSWAKDGTTDPTGGTMPPNGGAWVRHSRTITGLTIGDTYSAAAMLWAYSGIRASDVDALQIEYGTSASTY